MPKGLVAIDGPAWRHDGGWAPEVPALAPVANVPLLVHALHALREAGAGEVLVAGTGRALDAVAEVLDGAMPGTHRLELERPGATADALLAAASWFAGDHVVVHESDGMLLRAAGPLRDAVAAADEVDATVFFASGGPGGGPDARRVSGVHVFSPAILTALDGLEPGLDGRRSLLDAVDRLAARGGRVRAGVLESWWGWDGEPLSLLLVNHDVLDRLPAGPPPRAGDEHTRIEGRVDIHPDAVLEGAIVRGPAVIGARARVTDAYVGPYTTIGEGAVIENAEVEASLVLPRARIRHLGVRVEGSIVGAGASVGRDFAVPRALRLLLGSDASVTLG